MGLLKTAATVAVASSVHGRIQRRQQARWAAQDQALAGAPAPPPPAQYAAPVQPHQAYAEQRKGLCMWSANGYINVALVMGCASGSQHRDLWCIARCSNRRYGSSMSSQPEITQRDLRMRSKEIMDAVERGQAFTVTRDGHRIGELVPLRQRRRFVSRAEFAAMSRSAPVVDADAFRADQDAAADQAGSAYDR